MGDTAQGRVAFEYVEDVIEEVRVVSADSDPEAF